MAAPKTPATPTPGGSEGSFEAFFAFYAEVQKETDRAAIILGAAKLDQLLLEILKRALRPCATSGDDLLEDGDAPLGTFSARIRLVHRLGLIDDGFAKALHLVKRIRNDFAHDMGATLTAGAHANRVKELAAMFQDLEAFGVLVKAGGAISKPSAELRASLATLAMRLDGCSEQARALSHGSPFPLLPAASAPKGA